MGAMVEVEDPTTLEEELTEVAKDEEAMVLVEVELAMLAVDEVAVGKADAEEVLDEDAIDEEEEEDFVMVDEVDELTAGLVPLDGMEM